MSKHLSIIAAASLLATSAISAVAADLVHHDGFETCWSQALTKPQFLAALRSNIDGNSGCIPPQAGNQSGFDYTICNVANGCGSGAPGCPVALQAGPFSGDFVAGSFSAAGTANNIAAPITVAILGSCTLNITGITLTYALDYLMRTDGTDGVHTDDMQVPLVDITNYATSNNCNPLIAGVIASYLPQAITSAENGAAAAIEPGLRADTLERSICPLSAP